MKLTLLIFIVSISTWSSTLMSRADVTTEQNIVTEETDDSKGWFDDILDYLGVGNNGGAGSGGIDDYDDDNDYNEWYDDFNWTAIGLEDDYYSDNETEPMGDDTNDDEYGDGYSVVISSVEDNDDYMPDDDDYEPLEDIHGRGKESFSHPSNNKEQQSSKPWRNLLKILRTEFKVGNDIGDIKSSGK